MKRVRALLVVAAMAASTLTFVSSTPASASYRSCGSDHTHNWGLIHHSIDGRYWTGNFVAEPWYRIDAFTLFKSHVTTTYCR